jgi:hypothetical protein
MDLALSHIGMSWRRSRYAHPITEVPSATLDVTSADAAAGAAKEVGSHQALFAGPQGRRSLLVSAAKALARA